MLLAGAMLLRHVGEGAAATRLERAVAEVVAEGRAVTYDLRPRAGTEAPTSTMAAAVVERVAGA
jgi:isocitrate dehydrogenase (NAD+)